jgi:hypothetical protein
MADKNDCCNLIGREKAAIIADAKDMAKRDGSGFSNKSRWRQQPRPLKICRIR